MRKEKFGPRYGRTAGYIIVASEGGSFGHRFGGTSWRVVDDYPVGDGPELLMVLDLSDDRLATLRAPGLTELPVCSYLNCDVWKDEQTYLIDSALRLVRFTGKNTADVYCADPEDALPNPLPERALALRDMKQHEHPIDEDTYWKNCDEFLGGGDPIRLLGEPLWLQKPEEVECDCGAPAMFFLAMGYERLSDASRFLPDKQLFIGEAALYFFFCKSCVSVKVVSQPT